MTRFDAASVAALPAGPRAGRPIPVQSPTAFAGALDRAAAAQLADTKGTPQGSDRDKPSTPPRDNADRGGPAADLPSSRATGRDKADADQERDPTGVALLLASGFTQVQTDTVPSGSGGPAASLQSREAAHARIERAATAAPAVLDGRVGIAAPSVLPTPGPTLPSAPPGSAERTAVQDGAPSSKLAPSPGTAEAARAAQLTAEPAGNAPAVPPVGGRTPSTGRRSDVTAAPFPARAPSTSTPAMQVGEGDPAEAEPAPAMNGTTPQGSDDHPAALLTSPADAAEIVAPVKSAIVPQSPNGPAQQLLAALRTLGLDRPAGDQAGQSPVDAPTASQAERPAQARPALHTLSVALQPAHLGGVVLTVKRQDGRLSVTVAVHEPRALRALEDDRGLIETAVRAAGGSHDSLRIALQPSPAGGAQPPDGAATPEQAPADMSQGGEARRGRQPEPTHPSRMTDDPSPTEGARLPRLDRGLYL